jgi:UPF0716 protein FxsA
MWIFLAFLLVPLIEIGLFSQVGGLIGLWPTLGLVLLTAIVGTTLVRTQGARAMADLRRAMNELGDPTAPLAHGAMILFAGALLLTPGFFTDTMGILLLIPQVRLAVMRHLATRVKVSGFTMGSAPGRPPPPREPHRPDIIDAEYHELDDDTPPRRGPSGWTRH